MSESSERVLHPYGHNEYGDGMIKTWVRGKNIVFDNEGLGKILGIPFEGIADAPGKKWSEHPDFDPDEALRVVLDDEEMSNRRQKPNAEELNCEKRILHLICAKTLVPRIGNRQTVTYVDYLVMYCVLKRLK